MVTFPAMGKSRPGVGRSPRRLETVNRARVLISTLKSNGALPAAPSEAADSRPAPACSPPCLCPLRFSARRTGVQGRSPAALFPRFLSRKRNRAAGGTLPIALANGRRETLRPSSPPQRRSDEPWISAHEKAAAFRGRFRYLCCVFVRALSQLTVSFALSEYTVP